MRPSIVVACALAMGVSRADASPTARLTYSRAVGAESCPDEDSLLALVPCAYGGRLFACALGQAGAMQTSSEGVAITRSESLAWLAAGLRFGVEVPIERLTAMRIRSDLLADFAPATLRLNGATAWTAPPVAASLGGDVVAHF